MKKSDSRPFQILLLLLLSLAFAVPRGVLAQDHVVTSSDLQKDVAGASAARQQKIEQVNGFISSPEAQHAIKSAHIDYQQVKNGVSELSDDDLARLSARSEKAQKDFAAGSLSDRDLLIIIVAVAALILIIVAVR
jgi:hypothetical protein